MVSFLSAWNPAAATLSLTYNSNRLFSLHIQPYIRDLLLFCFQNTVFPCSLCVALNQITSIPWTFSISSLSTPLPFYHPLLTSLTDTSDPFTTSLFGTETLLPSFPCLFSFPLLSSYFPLIFSSVPICFPTKPNSQKKKKKKILICLHSRVI